ncbi:DUF11 domain-containing protein, partial [Nocardioides sp. 1609]|uniref:DUF11 domain-containing protein n=1 Tax=Nocardioides sp. 1609 TaxID=2508327 RepID=UPI00106F8D82
TVTNAGPSVARDVVLTDDLLDELDNVAVTGAPAGACTVTPANVATCDLGQVPASGPGSTVTLTITGDLPADYTGAVDNTASVTSPTDTTPDNNQSTSTGTAAPQADVAITKTRTSGAIVPGQPVTWNVTVTNAGPSVARDVVLTDDLLDDLTDVAVTGGPAGACTVTTANVVTCTLGDLPASGAAGTVRITITAQVPSGYTGRLDNTASLTSPTDTTPDNNTATSTGTAQPQADVTVTKTRTSGPVIPGRPVTWNVTVTNAGPSVARDVVLTDDLLDDLTDVEVTGAPADACTVTPANVATCDLGDLPASGAAGTVTITITAQVPSGYTGRLDNTASVTSPTDTTPANNEATSPGTAEPAAAVAITKTRTSGAIVPGQPVTWNVTVTNAGPSVARDVVVTDDLLDELDDVAVTGAPAGACTVTPANVVTCDLGDLAAGPDGTVSLTITAAVPATYSGALDNTATVVSPTDVTPGDDTSTATGSTEGYVDLSITKKLVATAVPGALVSWTLEATNDGPSTARDVVVTDELPASVTGATVTGPAGSTCTVTDGVVTCRLADLAVDETATVVVGGRLTPGFRGELVNTAQVGSSATETDPDDNTATATDPVSPVADLAVAKEVTPEAPLAGGPVTFTITVTNNGPSTATRAVVTDPLDAVVRNPRASATSGTTCRVATGTVTCEVADLAPGATAVVTVEGTVAPDATGPMTNTATITPGEETDPEPGDNEATVTTGPVQGADVQVAKEALAAEVTAGDRLDYRITVTNAGPSIAADVVVTDDLPEGMTVVSATAVPRGTCSITAGRAVVTCDLGDLAADQVVRVTLTAEVAGNAVDDGPATVVNEATAVSTTADPVAGNNADGTPVRVLPADDSGPDDGDPDDGGPSDSGDPEGPDLPDTGSDARIAPLTLMAISSLVLGAWLLRRSRRRTG